MQVNFGKTFIVGFEGTELDAATAAKLQEIEPAGIILYDTNIKEKKQVQKLIQDLKDLLGEDLLVSVDQEGGKVERLRTVSSSLPSMQALGRASLKLGRDAGLAFAPEPIKEYAQLLGTNLCELGFNMVFAPCADLATNPRNPIIGTRSLGANTQIVSEQIKIIIQELRNYGIIPCVKHFPGHGDTSKDSHLELPVINYGVQEYSQHIKPFVKAISMDIESVMIAHVLVKLKGDNLPASLSQQLIEDELRAKLNYQGAVISDEITMKALTSYGNYTEISEKMLNAGINLIIWNSNLDDALRAARELNLLDDKKLLSKYKFRLEKILELKSKIKTVDYELNIKELEGKMLEICKTALRAAQRRGNENIERSKGILTSSTLWTPQDDGDIFIYNHPKLEPEVFEQIFGCKIKQFANWQDIEKQRDKDRPVLVFSFQTANNAEQREAIEKLRMVCPKLIVVSTDQEDPEADIDLYGANRVHLEALRLSFR